ncbi:amidohydrolase family protein [Thiohalobacter thiocyanaticus]|nr:amidohydrolase family protein [Thiohalobacter thiocyanaticus]
MLMSVRLISLPVLLLAPALSAAQQLVDTHLHYDAAYARAFPPGEVVDLLERNRISHALVTGIPPRQVRVLHEADPQRILPLLGVYRKPADRTDWYADAELPGRVERQLKSGPWRGIGELHIFAADRRSPVLRRLAELAVAHELPLLLHADPAVVDTLYETVPGVTLIWAHAGTYPYPDLLADYLERYPRLHVDLSVRDGRIAPEGELAPDWYRLLVEYPDRFLLGVDTFSLARWQDYDRVVAGIRQWLAQLPPEVLERLARGNAARLFEPLNSGH